MVNDGVRFEHAACVLALKQHLLATLLLMREEYLAETIVEARRNMWSREGVESLHEGEIEALTGWLATSIVGGAYAAMEEFGRGSRMDRDNPALPGYMESKQWNPYREDDLAIRSRKAGPYKNIFGETVVSTAKNPGYNLEQKGGKYAPQPPRHALQTTARWMMTGRAQEIWQTALTTFPWGRFIIATPD